MRRNVTADREGNFNSALWKDLATETLQTLTDAKTNRNIQENAYGRLQWFQRQMTEQARSTEARMIKQLLSNSDTKSLWSAATATPLGSTSVFRIYRLPED